jgi:hypothetical protein
MYALKRDHTVRRDEQDHPYASLAQKIDRIGKSEWCDQQVSAKRLYVAKVVDRLRPQIQALFPSAEQKPGEAVPTLDLGLIHLRISKKKVAEKTVFAETSWSWEDAYGLIQKTQNERDPFERRREWRDIDAMARYLLEKDFGRLQGANYPPPGLTEHSFRPNPAVKRTGKREFTLAVDPGDFSGREKILQDILEREWSGRGYRLRLAWKKGDPALYHFSAQLISARSFVSHPRKSIELANLAWTKVAAHELGHVLGFDDHYYNSWNSRNCYYTQSARNADLMSNSENGSVQLRHWQLLDQAYPWGKPAATKVFKYIFEKDTIPEVKQPRRMQGN